ncbi:MAG: hypothetical protein JF623_01405 [Acidobacteria bacterium]|nr:hypothetical protein [Acidobacteriota bacterium]
MSLLPIVVVLLDGVADRAHETLGGHTGVEAARTPNLDALCVRGSCGVIYAVGPGRAPSSEVAHWSLLGYRPDEFPGRAVFEALGRGQDVGAEHAFAYAALRPAERREDGWWLTGRPDPVGDAEEAERLVARCDGIEIDGLTFALQHVWRGEAVLRVAGAADERVSGQCRRSSSVTASAARSSQSLRSCAGSLARSGSMRSRRARRTIRLPTSHAASNWPASGWTRATRSSSRTRRAPTRPGTRRTPAASRPCSRRWTQPSADCQSTVRSSASPATTQLRRRPR